MAYLLDTNIFIRYKNDMPKEYWPTVWDKFSELINTGELYTSVKVYEEINRGNDDLAGWLNHHAPNNFFIPIDEAVMNMYRKVQKWALTKSNYTEAARQQFAKVADAYLIASAAIKDLTLVTNELPAPNSKRSIKIPDVCNELGIKCCDFNTILRELDFKI